MEKEPSKLISEVQKERTQFIEYAVNARLDFCSFINSRQWESELRTESENLIIAYDQIVERLIIAHIQVDGFRDQAKEMKELYDKVLEEDTKLKKAIQTPFLDHGTKDPRMVDNFKE
jgi:hypothetical protein